MSHRRYTQCIVLTSLFATVILRGVQRLGYGASLTHGLGFRSLPWHDAEETRVVLESP